MSAFTPFEVGQRFGRLVVSARRERGDKKVRVICDCGTEKNVIASKLTTGWTVSCGCLHRERVAEIGRANATHGHTSNGRSSTYSSWAHMIWRCETRTAAGEYWRSRGITVCERWRSFENFFADMGERPSGRTLDRIDNDGHYEPGNCRRATPKEQAANRRMRKDSLSLR